MNAFDAFVGVDWSGARGSGQPGIQVVRCTPGRAAPRLVAPPAKAWTRPSLLAWLIDAVRDERLLVGLDFSFTFPFIDRGAYFPGEADSPGDARALWCLVESVCADAAGLYGGPFAATAPWSGHFYRRKGDKGARFARRHKRVERACADAGLGHPESVFHLIGPKQVGLGSLAGMRFLAALRDASDDVRIWPMERLSPRRSMVVEIFPRAFLAAAGHARAKVRTAPALNAVLHHYGARPMRLSDPVDDNVADSAVTAAALRALAGRQALWRPRAMTARVRRTEGWIFGVEGP